MAETPGEGHQSDNRGQRTRWPPPIQGYAIVRGAWHLAQADTISEVRLLGEDGRQPRDASLRGVQCVI